MDSPAAYPESPMEQDDAAYPCKGCGEVRLSQPAITSKPNSDRLTDHARPNPQILEEGKAFELGRDYCLIVDRPCS